MSELPKQSEEFRELLGQALDKNKTKPDAEYEKNLGYATGRFPDANRAERLRATYEQEQQNLEALRQEVADFLTNSKELDEAKFQAQYQDLESRIDDVTERILEFRDLPWWRPAREIFPSYFGDVRQIQNRKQFAQERIMQWVPRKEEIGRFLTWARNAHQARVVRGEIAEDTPIEILDVGGANGALGVLITDLARENGFNISYTVVDPDAEIVDKAKTAYVDNKDLDFRTQDSGELIASKYEKDGEISGLLDAKRSFIADKQKQFENLCRIYDLAHGLQQDKKLDQEQIQKIVTSLSKDFDIAVKPEALESSKAFVNFLQGDDKDWVSIPEQFLNRMNDKIREMNQEIERILSERPAEYDLVINSWMPMETDFTPDIRQANGAVIVYALARDGSTGIQNADSVRVIHSRSPKRIGEDYSYSTGQNYKADKGWIGPNTFGVRETKYPNVIASQVKKQYSEAISSSSETVRVEGQYPWESKNEAVPEPVKLDEQENDFRTPLWKLARELDPNGEY